MKKILTVLLLTVSATAFAHGPHGYWRHQGGGSWGWVAPVIIGGAIGYEIGRPAQPVIVTQQPPVIIQQTQNCSPWTEIRNPDGTITVTRTCNQ